MSLTPNGNVKQTHTRKGKKHKERRSVEEAVTKSECRVLRNPGGGEEDEKGELSFREHGTHRCVFVYTENVFFF